ncbi:hypothetical protein C8Q76DRAFT_694553 [Earliella scabrosa]|nr:hypothetical protein C8Q76DRAFT_694553 [Earliella scabrosa]
MSHSRTARHVFGNPGWFPAELPTWFDNTVENLMRSDELYRSAVLPAIRYQAARIRNDHYEDETIGQVEQVARRAAKLRKSINEATVLFHQKAPLLNGGRLRLYHDRLKVIGGRATRISVQIEHTRAVIKNLRPYLETLAQPEPTGRIRASVGAPSSTAFAGGHHSRHGSFGSGTTAFT